MRSSGRFLLRLPPGLHGQLKRLSAQQGVSLNQLCERILTQAVSQETLFIDQNLRERIQKRWAPHLRGIVLFGSQARGTSTLSSDVDLLLVLDSEASLERDLYRQWDELMQGLGGSVHSALSPQFVRLPQRSDEAGSLWLEVALDGRVLWESDHQISHLLGQLRKRIAAGDLQRKLTHGQPYWIRREEKS
jgi:predicted nucleotidyltransferase